jgi:hypothetical protein
MKLLKTNTDSGEQSPAMVGQLILAHPKSKLAKRIVVALLLVFGAVFVGRGVYYGTIEAYHFAKITGAHLAAVPADYQLNRAKRKIEDGEAIQKDALAQYQRASDDGKANVDAQVEAKNLGVKDTRPLKLDEAKAADFPNP